MVKTLKYRHIYLQSHKILSLNWIFICVQKKVLTPLPKNSKTADMEKKERYSDGKKNDEVIVNQTKSTPIEV